MSVYNLGPLEQEIMNCVWEQKGVTVGYVFKCLKRKRNLAYTTVMTIMVRLISKGLLYREKRGRVFIYFAKKSKKEVAKKQVKKILSSLINQYGKEAITAFTDELKKYK